MRRETDAKEKGGAKKINLCSVPRPSPLPTPSRPLPPLPSPPRPPRPRPRPLRPSPPRPRGPSSSLSPRRRGAAAAAVPPPRPSRERRRKEERRRQSTLRLPFRSSPLPYAAPLPPPLPRARCSGRRRRRRILRAEEETERQEGRKRLSRTTRTKHRRRRRRSKRSLPQFLLRCWPGARAARPPPRKGASPGGLLRSRPRGRPTRAWRRPRRGRRFLGQTRRAALLSAAEAEEPTKKAKGFLPSPLTLRLPRL